MFRFILRTKNSVSGDPGRWTSKYKGPRLEGKRIAEYEITEIRIGHITESFLELVRSMDFIEFTTKLLECFKQENVVI